MWLNVTQQNELSRLPKKSHRSENDGDLTEFTSVNRRDSPSKGEIRQTRSLFRHSPIVTRISNSDWPAGKKHIGPLLRRADASGYPAIDLAAFPQRQADDCVPILYDRRCCIGLAATFVST